jgi:hypothetical protein
VPGMALSRAGARVFESDTPTGKGRGHLDEVLDDQAWARLESLPDPRSPQGLIYPLPCLVAAAVCALTAAGSRQVLSGEVGVRAGPRRCCDVSG